jgi:hypothetical protein
VRGRADLVRTVARCSFPRGAILFLARKPTAARRRNLGTLPFSPPRPELSGRTVYFIHPARLRGKRSPFDFERALGVAGTARSVRVVGQILERMK